MEAVLPAKQGEGLNRTKIGLKYSLTLALNPRMKCLNRTKIGLKWSGSQTASSKKLSLNRTKIGLKYCAQSLGAPAQYPRLNRTKIGLKLSPLARFEKTQ